MNPGLHTMTQLQESLETEMKVLDYLYTIFDGMMDNLGDSELDDRKNEQWDVKLAVQCKDLQRNIVSSILTACQSGKKIVDHKLRNHMDEDIIG